MNLAALGDHPNHRGAGGHAAGGNANDGGGGQGESGPSGGAGGGGDTDPLAIGNVANSYHETSVAIDANGTAVIATILANENPPTACQNTWAVSNDWSTATPPTWAYHDCVQDPWPALTMSDGVASADYAGDPTIKATIVPGEFVYASLISQGFTTFDMAIALSIDGGVSFQQQTIVSTSAAGGLLVDQPVIAYDRVNDVFWAWWRNSTPKDSMCGVQNDGTACTYPQWVRKFHIDRSITPTHLVPTFVFDTNPVRTDTKTHGPANKSVALAAREFNGLPTLVAVYPDMHDQWTHCTPTSKNYLNGATRWWASWSTNDGATWHKSQIPGTDNHWPMCVGPGRSSNGADQQWGENRNIPTIIMNSSHWLVGITRSDNKNLSHSLGTRLHVYRTTDGTHWTTAFKNSHLTGLNDEFGQTLSEPSIPFGADKQWVFASWYDTRSDPNHGNRKVTRAHRFSTDGGKTWSAVGFFTGAGIPWLLTDWWKDYSGSACSPVDGKCLDAWADTRSGGFSQIFAAVTTPH